MTEVCGRAAPGFEAVRSAFEANFDERGEVGAAFSVVCDGQLVVDLWGGLADGSTGAAWQRDTLAWMASCTKGLAAVCMLILLERGQLSLEDSVAKHWPEFAQQGKERTLIRHVMSHTAGLPGVTTPLQREDLYDAEKIAGLLAAQAPFSPAGEVFSYHALTYGYLCSELVRRIDGRRLATFFREEVAEPLGLEVWIGCPPEQRAHLTRVDGSALVSWEDQDALRADPVFRAVWENPPIFDEPLMWNEPACFDAEMAGSNGYGTARSLARLFGCLAADGTIDGVRLLSPATIERARWPLVSGVEQFTQQPAAYGIGFQLQTSNRSFGGPESAFGSKGAGGSVCGAWPEQRIGYAYVMNKLLGDPELDPRSAALIAALEASAGVR